MTKRELIVRDLLLEDGIKPGHRGFEFLAKAISQYNPTNCLTGPYGLYADVAQQFPATLPQRVERNMRSAIAASNGKGITNGNYIAYMYHKLLKEEDKLNADR